ncbi:MAG: hypothetical protein JW814_12135 [Candidatus Krumholzibacteriota bacterium]|nr:hypothetical protein [Candidatus Krumholzibacteriota bacterium]
MRWIIPLILIVSGCHRAPCLYVNPDRPAFEGEDHEASPEEFELKEASKRFRPMIMITEKKETKSSPETIDMRASLAMMRSRITGRVEKKGKIVRPVVFFESRPFAGTTRVYGGDFMPDLGLGALLAGYRFSYPFSSGYPLRREKLISKHVSFYSPGIRGAALGARDGGSRIFLFAGRYGKWDESGFRSERQVVTGGRLERLSGRYRSGLTFSQDRGALTIGIDNSIERAGYVAALELLQAAGAKRGLVWGWRRDRGSCRAGILIFRLPSGLGNRFGDIPGGPGEKYSERTGYSITGSLSVKRSQILRGSFEKRNDDDGISSESICRMRVEYASRFAGVRCKLSYSRSTGRKSKFLPLPPEREDQITAKDKIGLLFSSSPAGVIKPRIQAVCLREDDNLGFLFSPSVSFGVGRSLFRTTLFCSLHRSVRGRSVFYNYEPSLPGSYSWKYLAGNGSRFGFHGIVGLGPIKLNIKLAGEDSGRWESEIQMKYDL